MLHLLSGVIFVSYRTRTAARPGYVWDAGGMRVMADSGDRDLAYHHSEIARLKALIIATRPNSRRAGFVRAILKYHEDILSRPERVMSR